MRLIESLALAAVVATAACTTTYAFVPATSATTSLYGYPAAEYPIPPQAPHGSLRVAAYGVEPLSPAEAPDESVASLHVRVFVSNTSGQAWTLDTREQQATLEGHATSTPAFATASPGGSSPPVVTIDPSSSRTVDLFFLLPEGMQTASTLPAFQFTATVHTDAGPVSETTPFERVEVDDTRYAYYYAGPYAGYDPWLYGYEYWDWPFYFNPGFVAFYGGHYPYRYWGHPFYAHGPGWGRPGYYHGFYGGYYGRYHGGYRGYPGGYHGHPGGYHGSPGGGGHGGHR